MAMSGVTTLVDSLDLVCCDESGVGGLPTTSPTLELGWLSPRISFSSGFIDKNRVVQQDKVVITGRDEELWHEDVGADFEFCMATSTNVDARLSGAAGSMFKPADELFHKGKLRPLSLPLRSQVVEQVLPMMQEEQRPQLPANPSVPNKFSLEQSMSSSRSTPVSTRCSDDVAWSTNPSVGKPPGWKEGFGLLRRARSDGTRCWPASGAPENNSPPIPTKASLLHPPQTTSKKQQSFASSSLRMLFKQPSVDHAVERSGVQDSSYPQAKRTSTRKAPKNRPPADSVPVSSAAPPSLDSLVASSEPSPEFLGNPVLSVLHVASPIHRAELVLESKQTLPPRPQSPTAPPRARSRSSRSRSRPTSLVSEGYVNGFFKKDSMERELLGSTSGYGSGRRQKNPGRVVMRQLDDSKDGVQTFYRTTSCSSTPPAPRIVLRNLERCSTASGKQIAAAPTPQENQNLSGSALRAMEELQQQIHAGPNRARENRKLSRRAPIRTQEELQQIIAPGPKPAQENHNQVRIFMRTRGAIRRSDQGLTSSSYLSNVRVAPVLNLPQVCIGSGIRSSSSSSSSSSSGHLARLRSLFFFKKVKADCNPAPSMTPPLPIAH